MKDTGRNILILDPGFFGKSALRDALAGGGFTVAVATDIDQADAALASFMPDIILCRASGAMLRDNSLLCSFHERAALKAIPFVVIATGMDMDFYLRGLERGIFHAIMPPFSAEYLRSRIADLAGEERALPDASSVLELDFDYRGSSYRARIHPSQLARFVISVLEDSLNQSAAITKYMHRKSLVRQHICRPDLYEGTRTKTDMELEMERDLYRALEQEEFVCYYQPIISLPDDIVAGFEALVRWNHPRRGLVAPEEFIPVVERLPLIIPLGFRIIEETARQLASWCRMFPSARSLRVSVNLSATQFIHPELSADIARIIKTCGTRPEQLAFEITESAFMSDMDSANVQLLSLKSRKHPIYMDDFGTGYSSLSYLRHFPVDTIKIDQSFVKWMNVDEQSELIVRAIVGLARNLRMSVVAEGVEEESHLRVIKDIGCDYAQGFHFAPPMDSSSATEYLAGFYRRGRL